MRALRTTPPRLQPDLLARERLLEVLRGRFSRPLTLVVGPAGFGKTTLLGQAIADNHLDPAGIDIWFRASAADADAAFLEAGLAAALNVDGASKGVDTVADALWSRAPTRVALMIDDVHAIPEDSPGARFLGDVLRSLPTNGHAVLASRQDLALDFARELANGDAMLVAADSLQFDTAEIATLARQAGLDLDVLAQGQGWPALTRLLVSIGRPVAQRYLWDEIVAQLPSERRAELATLVSLGGADAGVLAAALERSVDVDALMRAIPLLSMSRSGWLEAHSLWTPVVADRLSDLSDDRARRRAADHLAATHRVDRAVAVMLDADLDDDDTWAALAGHLSAACGLWISLIGEVPFRHWLERLPALRRDEPEALLVAAAVARRADGSLDDAAALIRRASDLARHMGRLHVETSALSQLAHIAWWRDDLDTMSAIYARAQERAALGYPLPDALMALADAILADIRGDDEAILDTLTGVASDDPDLTASLEWFRARALVGLGRAKDAIPHADRAAGLANVAFHSARLAVASTRWYAGQAREALALEAAALPGVEALPRDRFLSSLSFAIAHAHVGNEAEAAHFARLARGHARFMDPGRTSVYLDALDAVVALSAGDEEDARASIRRAIDTVEQLALAQGIRVLRPLAAITCFLVPECRERFDAIPLGPDHLRCLAVAAALLDARAGRPVADPQLEGEAQVVALPIRYVVELAVRRGDAATVEAMMDRFAGPTRRTLHSLLEHTQPELAHSARALARVVPVAPDGIVDIGLLGPATLRHADGSTPPDWRRERVRSLFAMLVLRGAMTREALMATLWPDLDLQSASSNLRRTLNYLHGVLEPHRTTGSAPWFVRTVADSLVLHESGLRIDCRVLEAEIDAAQRADGVGAPSTAIEHYERAVTTWRGDFCAELFDDWVLAERDRLRARFVNASIRLGELLVGRGEWERAIAIAGRALDAEPWSEPAHRLAVAAHLAHDDRAAAQRAAARAVQALADIGIAPSDPATVMLLRAGSSSHRHLPRG